MVAAVIISALDLGWKFTADSGCGGTLGCSAPQTSLSVLFPGDWAWRIFLPLLFLLILIYLAEAYGILVVACGISVPDLGSNPGLLHWQSGILTTGPPGKSLPSLS